MESAVEKGKRPSVGLADRIACVIGGVTAVACLGIIIHAICSNLPFLLNIGGSQPGAWGGALLQIPVVFAALLLLTFSVSGFRNGLKGDGAVTYFRESLLVFLVLLVCFIINIGNFFVTSLLKEGLASDISLTMLYIFLEAVLVMFPAVGITMFLLIFCSCRVENGQKKSPMREFILSVKGHAKWAVFLVLSATFIFTGQRSSAGIHVDAFTDFQAADLAGNPADQTIFADHDLTLVNVWATFCGPCKAEMPDLAELHEESQDRGFQVVGICGDVVDAATGQLRQSEYEDALKIAKETHADAYLNLNPAGDLLAGFINDHVPAYPTSLFVDSAGNQVGDMIIGSRDKDAWKAEIDKRLEMLARGER